MFKHIQHLAFALCALLVIPAAAQVPSYVPTDGLVGWWPFNGNANDESGNGNDGVVNGAMLTEDRFNAQANAYIFDGNSFIDVQHSNSLTISEAMTFSLWFKQGAMGNTINYLIQKGSGGGCSNSGFHIAVDYNFGLIPNGTKLLQFGQNGSCAGIGSEIFLDESWHSMIIVYNPIFGHKLYIDGVIEEEGFPNGCDACVISNENSPMRIGALYSSLGGFNWNGQIDDIAIYNRALTEQEIQNLYTGTTPPPCVSLPSNLQQGLVGYWPFCSNANDESGNGNDGVVNGATLTEDRFGNANAAYGFDGVDDYIQTAQEGVLGNANRTLSFWAKQLAVFDENNCASCSRGAAISYGSNITGPSQIGQGFYCEFNVGATGVAFDGNETTASYSTPNPVNDDEWHHYTFVMDNVTDALSVQVYQDGEILSDLAWSYLAGFNINTTAGEPLAFGRRTYDNFIPTYFNGGLDDISFWNRALTPEEVQELYTLDACTFTVFDTLTVYETVYDTVYTYETIYDTVTTYVTVTDTLLIDITFTGIEGQPSWLNTVTVFPNPASDHITIDYGNFALMAGYNTIITDAAGATVYSSAVNSQQVEIDINAWGAMGVYYMSVYDASGELVAVRHIVLE
jgi:hypothetical protein